MDTRYDIVAVLDCCVDLVLSGGDVVPKFGQREQFIGDYSVEMGGSGCIFAAQAAKLGLRAAGIGVIGDDAFGQTVWDTLSASGVDTRFVRRDGHWKTGLGVLLCVEGDRAILTYNGTIDGTMADDITDEILSSARHLHISSYYLLHNLRPHWLQIVKRAKRFGATVSLDTNWDPQDEWNEDIYGLLRYADVFLPNDKELLRIARKDDLQEAAAYLAGMGPLLAVKRGSQGAMAVSGKKIWTRDACPVEAVDSVGAGDSFNGGFLWGWLQGLPMELCLAAGCFCGASSAAARGGTRGQADRNALVSYLDGEGMTQ